MKIKVRGDVWHGLPDGRSRTEVRLRKQYCLEMLSLRGYNSDKGRILRKGFADVIHQHLKLNTRIPVR